MIHQLVIRKIHMKRIRNGTRSEWRFAYEPSGGGFVVSALGRTRVVIGELALNLGMTHLSLQGGRIAPDRGEPSEAGVRFPLRLKAIGSRSNIRLAQPAGFLKGMAVGQAMCLSYENTAEERHFSPDEAVCCILSELPGVQGAVFYQNRSNEFQNFDCEGLWWSQAVFVGDPARQLSHDWGLLALWKYDDGTVGGILPLTNDQTLGRLRGTKDGLGVISSDFKSGVVISEYPMALLAFGKSEGDVRDSLFEAARCLSPRLILRKPKDTLCKPFDTLGWCSWNAFGASVTERDVRGAVDALRARQVPVGYMLLDDGWLHHEKPASGKALQEGITGSTLLSYEPDAVKFPSGLRSLIAEVKAKGIPFFGLWHALNGYWAGISPRAGMVKDHPGDVFKGSQGTMLPEPGKGFYRRWYEKMKSWGVDFVKVDNQGFPRQHLPYARSLPAYAAGLQQDFQSAAKASGFPVIHCMATHAELIFNSTSPHLLRVTNDFCPDDDFSARLHLVNNFYNAFWLGKVFWTDFDMFQSNDRNAEVFAKMLALSHSPIYVTDPPDAINTALLRRLVLPAGEIPRYETPGEPLSARFFENPYGEGRVLTVIARVHGITTVGVFNAVETGRAAVTQIAPADLGYHDPCLVYSEGALVPPHILSPDQPVRISLKGLRSDLLTFSPVRNGFAPVGVVDYYAAPAILETMPVKAGGAWLVTCRAGGLFVAFCSKRPGSVRSDGRSLTWDASGCLRDEGYHWQDGLLRVRTTARSIHIQT